MKRLFVSSTVLVLLFSSLASAEVICDDFCAAFDANNQLELGTGTGWNGGEWVSYPSGWWNQWFYDHPPIPGNWKKITYGIDLDLCATPGPMDVVVAINWSTPDFPPIGPLGPPPMDDAQIVRQEVFDGSVVEMQTVPLEGEIIIPDYNPEWVSIDIMVLGGEPTSQVSIDGWICHECIPEPSTVVLLVTGALALVLFARRRR